MSVEFTLAAPLLVLLLMAAIQVAMWAHATHIAQAAANTGVQVARAYNSTAQAGDEQAEAMVARLAGTILTDTDIQTRLSATQASVTITGRAITVVPGLRLPVQAAVTAPRELIGTAQVAP